MSAKEPSVPVLLRQASDLAKQGSLEIAKKDVLKQCITRRVALHDIDQAFKSKMKLKQLLQDKNWTKLTSELQQAERQEAELAEPAMTRNTSELAEERGLEGDEKALLKELLKMENKAVSEWIKSGKQFSELSVEIAQREREHAECVEDTKQELEALFGIYTSDITVAQCLPLCVKISVIVASVDCGLQLGFLLPELYPLREPAEVSAYIPPPWDSSGSVVNELLTFLQEEARKNIGMGALFPLVEAAKSWLEDHSQYFVKRNAGIITESANLLPHLKGEPTVDEREVSLQVDKIVQQVQERTGMSGARARKQLRDVQWEVEKVAKQKPGKKADDDQEALAEIVRLTQTIHAEGKNSTFTCLACLDDIHSNQGAAMVCGHWACRSCWTGYFQDQINDGKCFIPCVGHKCVEMVHDELIMGLVNAATYKRYQRWLRFSFVKLQGWKWCPNSECSGIAKAPTDSKENIPSKVACQCGVFWCFHCLQPAHWPLTCSVVGEHAGSTVLADVKKKFDLVVLVEQFAKQEIATKSCPKCRTPWWKNGGCNHFTCTCGFQFCWICMKNWNGHSGDYYNCQENAETKEVLKEEIKVSTGTKEVRVADSAEISHLRNYVEREVYHTDCLRRLQLILQDVPKHLAVLPGWKASQLFSSVHFLLDCHTLLRASYIFFFIHASYFCLYSIGTLPPGETNSEVNARKAATAAAKPLELLFNRFEFSVTMLDLVIAPVNPKNRSASTFEQFQKSMLQVQPKAQSFSDAVVAFLVHVKAFRGRPEPFVNQFEKLQEALEKKSAQAAKDALDFYNGYR